MTAEDEKRHQRDVGGALLIGAVTLAVLLGVIVFGLMR